MDNLHVLGDVLGKNGHAPQRTRHRPQTDTRVVVEERMVQVPKDEWYQGFPAQLGKALGLSLREAVLVGTLWYMCRENGRGKPCMPTQAFLMDKLLCSEETVDRCVKKVEALGLVAVIRGKKGTRKRNRYFVNLPDEWFDEIPESQARGRLLPF